MGRRIAVSSALALALGMLAAMLALAPAQGQTPAQDQSGPRFRADGPDADAYGRAENYPTCTGLTYLRELRCQVGAFSHFDEIFPARIVAAPSVAAPLRRAGAEPSIAYTHDGRSLTLDQYLDANHVTGLLIAKGDTILVERYQYARTDKHRLNSFSMAKTIIALLIGIAVGEGAIASIDDPAETYVPGLKGSEYGRTPIRALLQMASGVQFVETYTDPASDVYVLARLMLEQDPAGSIPAVTRFNTRYAPPGQRFSYSSAESLVLGLVLAGATKRSVADFTSEKLWKPLGAEADAAWLIDAKGQEITFAYFNAVLRDWARLGLMLAHDGRWQGKTIVARDWLVAATSIGPDSPFWTPAVKPGTGAPGYGYQVWLIAGDHRMFMLRGLRGQFVLVDPETKLVLVQTALRANDVELLSMWHALRAQLR